MASATPKAAEPTDIDSIDSEQLPGGDSSEREQPMQLHPDTRFELLKNQRRRDALTYLDDQEATTTLSDLAEHVAALENDTTVAELSSKQRKRVYVALYQVHLPMMDDAGVVDFNRSRGIIERTDLADHLRPYLNDDPVRWWTYYLFGTGFGAGTYVVGALTFGPQSWFATTAVALLVAVMTVLALVQRSQTTGVDGSVAEPPVVTVKNWLSTATDRLGTNDS